VTTGDEVPTESGFLRGHGTVLRDGKLTATVSGFIERVNKLISVRPLNLRYQGEIGDVVIGRINEIADKRWRVDLNSRQNAVLMLSSINLPGGVQRRRTHEDSLTMRNFFTENDLVSAEVHSVLGDGAVSLHTRSLKYGKLEGGMFLCVPAALIKRTKQHFHTLPDRIGVDLILGCNGYIWIAPTAVTVAATLTAEADASKGSVAGNTATASSKSVSDAQLARVAALQDPALRERMARVRNSIVALAKCFIAIHLPAILDVYDESTTLGLSSRHMLNPELMQRITQTALARAHGTSTSLS